MLVVLFTFKRNYVGSHGWKGSWDDGRNVVQKEFESRRARLGQNKIRYKKKAYFSTSHQSVPLWQRTKCEGPGRIAGCCYRSRRDLLDFLVSYRLPLAFLIPTSGEALSKTHQMNPTHQGPARMDGSVEGIFFFLLVRIIPCARRKLKNEGRGFMKKYYGWWTPAGAALCR